MNPVCGMIVLHPDGTRETLRYDAYAAMKHDARSMEERKTGAVLYWWFELEELKDHGCT